MHPNVIAAYLDGTLSAAMRKHATAPTRRSALRADEAAVMMLLRRFGRASGGAQNA